MALFLSTLLTPEDAVDIPELSTEVISQQDNVKGLAEYNSFLASLSKRMDESERTLRIAVRKSRSNRRLVDNLTEDDFQAKVMRIK